MSEPLKAGDRVRFCKAYADCVTQSDGPGTRAVYAAARGTVLRDEDGRRPVRVRWDHRPTAHGDLWPGCCLRRADG